MSNFDQAQMVMARGLRHGGPSLQLTGLQELALKKTEKCKVSWPEDFPVARNVQICYKALTL